MYDRRIVRGNTYAITTLPAVSCTTVHVKRKPDFGLITVFSDSHRTHKKMQLSYNNSNTVTDRLPLPNEFDST